MLREPAEREREREREREKEREGNCVQIEHTVPGSLSVHVHVYESECATWMSTESDSGQFVCLIWWNFSFN